MLIIVGIGFEVMLIVIVIIGEIIKMGVVLFYLLFDLVLFDVDLIFGLLLVVIVVIGIDVMVYVIESYISKLKKNLLFDLLVWEVLCLLVVNLECVVGDGGDCEVC